MPISHGNSKDSAHKPAVAKTAKSWLLDLLFLPPLLALTIWGSAAQAFDGAAVDKEIAARLEKISKLQNSGDDFEKLAGANRELLKYLKATGKFLNYYFDGSRLVFKK